MRKISLKKLAQRVVTIALLAPTIVFIILFDHEPYGTLPFLVFIIAIAVISLNEYFHMASNEKEDPFFLTGHFVGVSLIGMAFVRESAFIWKSPVFMVLSALFLGIFLVELNLKKLLFPTDKSIITLRGIIYIGWCYSYFVLIRNLPQGKALVFYVLFTIWALDITAYVIGMTLGEHKLDPKISPKKSIEGAIGGFLAAVVVSFLIVRYYPGLQYIGWLNSLVLGGIIGVLGQSGDLYESLIKRSYNVKDSSNILPGHGGILDRADSFVLLAPLVYYYLNTILYFYE